MPTRFSIIMPAYNGAKVISRAIESIQAQTFGDYEFIVVDDHSSDDTRDVVKAFAQRDARIRLLSTTKNSGGPAAPKNVGIDNAGGDFIVFCDQDDCYTPEKLQRFDGVLRQHPETELLFSDYWVQHTDRDTQRYRYLHDKREFLTRASAYLQPAEAGLYNCQRFIGCMCGGIDTGMATISVAIRRSSLMQEPHFFDTRYRVVDDIDLWMRLAARLCVRYLDEPLSVYFSSPDSLSSRKHVVDQEAVDVHDAAAARFETMLNAQELTHHRALRSRMAYRLACTRFNEASACLGYAWQSFRLRPNLLAAKLLAERSGRWLLRI